jgi:pimeloyl-ACP methyl ester carboxylesterase
VTERETRTFRSYDGTRLACHLLGAGPPVLCVPGGPGRASSYLRDLAGLSASRTLVMLDNRGTGMSAFPDDPTTLAADRLPDDVEALRHELGIDAAALLGHSAGSIVAALYAARHPEHVRGLVLVTPSGQLIGAPVSDVAEIHESRSGEEWYAEAAEARDGLAGGRPGGRGELERLVRPFYYGRWDDEIAAHAHAADREMSPRAAQGYAPAQLDVGALAEQVRSIRVPTLVVAGEHDGLTGVAGARAVADAVPASRFGVIQGAGHFPWVDAPETFHALVEEFLQRLES